ncbi:helix-turn-helix transcriptional regulator [Chitinibacter sp. S2-10]|uniref:helix-turn-helix transcriptional regulator n=1 Tax=Chitinibacter sp. S2-10 TaxID=3373597 RepID=UPI00397799D5
MATEKTVRFLRIKELAKMIGMGKSSIYDRLNPKSKRYEPTFPRPIKLGVGTTVWASDEVESWMAQQIAAARMERGDFSN